MDTFTQFSLVGLGLFLVLLNGYFVASEFAIVKVRGSRIRQLVESGKRGAGNAQILVEGMDEYLSATQLGITLASLALGWVGEPAFASLFEPLLHRLGVLGPVVTHSVAAGLAFLLITFLHIVIGELAPKTLAIQRAEATILWISAPLKWFYRLSYPMIWVLNGAATFLLRAFGLGPASEDGLAHSEEELRLILADSHSHGVLDRDKIRMLERVLDFTNRSVRQVMLPSVEVAFLDQQKSLEENFKTAQKFEHTRYPLCDRTFDRVLGIIHVKDLLWQRLQPGTNLDIGLIKRPVWFVPESKDIRSLLTEFRQTRTHLAVVVDEHGTTVGIVTLEDILEELVGEIQDEFDIDVPLPWIRKTGPSQYMIHGRTLLEDLEAALKITIEDDENDTIGGHVMMLLGRTAKVGDEVVVAGAYRVRVIGIKGFQIIDLVCDKIVDPSPQGPDRSAEPRAR